MECIDAPIGEPADKKKLETLVSVFDVVEVPSTCP